jgi:uncharacterized protein YigE (DUF2233 family)
MRGSEGRQSAAGWLGRRGAALRGCLLALLVLGGLSLVLSARALRPAGWRAVGEGLAYRVVHITASDAGGRATLHVLRVDPRRYRIRLVTAGEGATATAQEMAERHGAVAAINGGFFDERFRPLGLRVTRGRELRPLRQADWGVFLIRAGKAAIVHTRDYRPHGVEEALQCGPRLVVNGRVTRLKRQSARRACLGIDRQGRVLMVVTEGADLDATRLARVLRAPEAEGGLACRDALNLDGGPSAQLHVAARGLHLRLPGTWGVPDGLAVFPR